jgi:phytoene synthase
MDDDTGGLVRMNDRDRYAATLFAPADVRPRLFALHGFDLALADVARTTTEVAIGLIRLAWWRDAVAGSPPAGAPLLAAVHAAGLDALSLVRLAEAHMDWLEGGEHPGARLFAIAAALLGEHDEAAIAEAGRYWGAGQSARAGRTVTAARPAGRYPSRLRPVTALAAVARRDIAGRCEPRGTAGRQLAMLRHMLTGRI